MLIKNLFFKLIFVPVLLLNGFAQFSPEFQNEISGFVFDNSSGKPLEYVNLYISNTTIGASTDRNGYYKIRSIPPGLQELIIAIVGYKYETKKIWIKEDSKLKFNFKLIPEVYETSAIEVEAERPEHWLNELEKFRKKFFGNSEFSKQCKILNPEIIEFDRKSFALLTAKTKQPLIIENNALGFKIECLLLDFYWDNGIQRWGWEIKPHFSKLASQNNKDLKKWEINQKKAYDGSLYHFLNSLVKRNLLIDGFNVYFVDYAGDKVPRIDFRQTLVEYDSLLTKSEIADEYLFKFGKVLMIVYNNIEYSWLKLRFPEIILEKQGYPQTPNPFEVYGHWAESGVADLLPKYFNREEVDNY